MAPFSKDSTGRVELYNKDTESWYNLTSYHELIGLTAFTGLKSLVEFLQFLASGISDCVLIFGGFGQEGPSDKVFKMDAATNWSVSGQSMLTTVQNLTSGFETVFY